MGKKERPRLRASAIRAFEENRFGFICGSGAGGSSDMVHLWAELVHLSADTLHQLRFVWYVQKTKINGQISFLHFRKRNLG